MEELLYKSFFISVSFRDAATLLYTLFDLPARFSPSFLSPPPPSRKTFFRKISHRHILVVVRRAVCRLCSIFIVLVNDHLQISVPIKPRRCHTSRMAGLSQFTGLCKSCIRGTGHPIASHFLCCRSFQKFILSQLNCEKIKRITGGVSHCISSK